MIQLLFHAEVEDDLKDAARWYDGRRAGLGDDFMEIVEETLEKVVSNPYRYAPLERDVRCVRMKRFPYGIFFYVFREQVVVVLAVVHKSRDPEIWRSRRQQRDQELESAAVASASIRHPPPRAS